MLRYLYLGLILIILFSCQSKEVQIQSQKIDSLLVTVDSLNQKILNVEIDSIHTILSETKKMIEFLSTSGTPGSAKNVLEKINTATGIKQTCKRFIDKYTYFQKELAFTEHQLLNLQHDVEIGEIGDSLFNKYFNEESSILNDLNNDIQNSFDWLNYEINVFKDFYAEMEEITDSLLRIEESIELNEKN